MKRRYSAGYTIIEVMIVLAVTGGLLVAAVLSLSGRQAQTEVNQSARDFEAHVQTIATNVANGFYPNGFSCTPSGNTVTIGSGSPKNPGSNQGCIFLGKIINLHESNLDTITVVGPQYKSGTTTDITQLSDITPATADTVTENYDYTYSLRLQKVVAIGAATTYKALGFMLELGGGIGGGATASGSRGVLLYGITGNVSSNPKAQTTVDPTTIQAIPRGVRLCFLGGNDKKVEITIGAAGSQTSTNVLIASGVGTDCD